MSDTEAEKKAQADSQSAMLKWILGGVAAGIVGIAFFAQVAFNTFMTRDEAQQNFLRQDIKAAMKEMITAVDKSNDKFDALVRAVDNNTAIMTNLRDDTRMGVWKNAPETQAKQ